MMHEPDLLPYPSVKTVNMVLYLLTGHFWIPPGPRVDPHVEGEWFPKSAAVRWRRVLVTVDEEQGTFHVEVYEVP